MTDERMNVGPIVAIIYQVPFTSCLVLKAVVSHVWPLPPVFIPLKNGDPAGAGIVPLTEQMLHKYLFDD